VVSSEQEQNLRSVLEKLSCIAKTTTQTVPECVAHIQGPLYQESDLAKTASSLLMVAQLRYWTSSSSQSQLQILPQIWASNCRYFRNTEFPSWEWKEGDENTHPQSTNFQHVNDKVPTSGRGLPPCGQFCWPSRYAYWFASTYMRNQDDNQVNDQPPKKRKKTSIPVSKRTCKMNLCADIHNNIQSIGNNHFLHPKTSCMRMEKYKLDTATIIACHHPILIVAPYHWSHSQIMCLPQQSNSHKPNFQHYTFG
jgi:hypothetical protein